MADKGLIQVKFDALTEEQMAVVEAHPLCLAGVTRAENRSAVLADVADFRVEGDSTPQVTKEAITAWLNDRGLPYREIVAG